ncbi:hypothetical protein ACFLT2_12655 [Acidobacteriota bacterium]
MNKSTHHHKKIKHKMKHQCAQREATVKVFLKETGQEEKYRLLDHIFSCPECLTEFSVLKEVWKKENSLLDTELEQTLEKAKSEQVKSVAKNELRAVKQTRQSRQSLLFSPINIAVAAAVLIAAVLTIYVTSHNRPGQIPLEREVGSEIFRTIEPEGAIDNLSILFRWSPVKDAREYTIEVLDNGLEMIYRKEGILVPSFALPDKIYTQLQVSRTYFWKVVATLDSEKRIESEFEKFYLIER